MGLHFLSDERPLVSQFLLCDPAVVAVVLSPRSSQLSPALKPLQAPPLSLRMLVMQTGTRGSLELSSKTQRKELGALLEQLKRLGPQRLVVSLRRAVEASTLRAKTIQVTVDTAPRILCPMVTQLPVQRQAREVGGGAPRPNLHPGGAGQSL